MWRFHFFQKPRAIGPLWPLRLFPLRQFQSQLKARGGPLVHKSVMAIMHEWSPVTHHGICTDFYTCFFACTDPAYRYIDMNRHWPLYSVVHPLFRFFNRQSFRECGFVLGLVGVLSAGSKGSRGSSRLARKQGAKSEERSSVFWCPLWESTQAVAAISCCCFDVWFFVFFSLSNASILLCKLLNQNQNHISGGVVSWGLWHSTDEGRFEKPSGCGRDSWLSGLAWEPGLRFDIGENSLCVPAKFRKESNGKEAGGSLQSFERFGALFVRPRGHP